MKLRSNQILASGLILIGLLAGNNVTVNAANDTNTAAVSNTATIDDASSSMNSSSDDSSIPGSLNEVQKSSSTTSSSSSNLNEASSNSSANSNAENTSNAPDTSANDDADIENFFQPGTRSNLHPVAAMRSSLPTIHPTDKNRPDMDFIDISSNNGNISVASFKKMKSYGIAGVVVKLTESTSYINPLAKSQIANAKAAGLVVSAYHYSWFTSDAQARSEADYFAKAAANLGLPKSTVMANDLEERKILGQANHTQNSLAFQNELKRLGYSKVYHYVSKSLIQYGQINAGTFGNKNFWVAQYLYDPTPYCDTAIANRAYGAWQWSPQLVIPGVNGYFDISIDHSGIFTNAVADNGGYKQGPDGNYYWYNADGSKYTGFQNYMGTYYYFTNGVRQDNQWINMWGNKYYMGSDGRAYEGVRTINGIPYNFGTDHTYYSRGGYLLGSNGYNWYNADGSKYTGFQNYMGTYYYFINGVRQDNQWINMWGNKYYVGSDGRAYEGVQTINGIPYNFGTDHTYYSRGGYLLGSNGYNWYNADGSKYTGFQNYMGTYYYFTNGVRQDNQWINTWGNKYYVGSDGRAYEGVHIINSIPYNFGTDHTYYSRGGYLLGSNGYNWYNADGSKYTGFKYYMSTYYYFVNGVRQNNQWVNMWGNKYYVGSDGRAYQGVHVINGKTYNFGNDGTFYVR